MCELSGWHMLMLWFITACVVTLAWSAWRTRIRTTRALYFAARRLRIDTELAADRMTLSEWRDAMSDLLMEEYNTP